MPQKAARGKWDEQLITIEIPKDASNVFHVVLRICVMLLCETNQCIIYIIYIYTYVYHVYVIYVSHVCSHVIHVLDVYFTSQ